jgi:opacity protein-like surface antigen
MIRSTRLGAGLLAAAAVVLMASQAFAQPAAKDPPGPAGAAGAAGKKDAGYGYEFSDDPLNAGGFGPHDATIRVRPGPVRTTLIRPRTSFVPEMLESVENL